MTSRESEHRDELVPHDPPLLCGDLPSVGGGLGPAPEDFVVDEIIERELGTEGEHVWVRIRKRGLTTQDAVEAVARAAGVRPSEVGSAGMKDKHAVTTQWLSLPRAATPPAEWSLPESIEVLEHGFDAKKLRTGQLRGNRFAIRLHGVEVDALASAGTIFERLLSRGLPNYFGAQRFGIGGANLARAFHWLGGGGARNRKRSRFHAKLYPSVIQSEAFNRYLTARRQLGLDRLLDGEVVRLDGTGSVFVVEDPERELTRLEQRDIHLTGPIFGPKMRAARGAALVLEEQAMSDAQVTSEVREGLARFADGTRRDLVVYPTEHALSCPSPGVLEVSFFLPSGSYATQLLRELTRSPFLGARVPSQQAPERRD